MIKQERSFRGGGASRHELDEKLGVSGYVQTGHAPTTRGTTETGPIRQHTR